MRRSPPETFDLEVPEFAKLARAKSVLQKGALMPYGDERRATESSGGAETT